MVTNPFLDEVAASDWTPSEWLTWLGNDASYLHWPHGSQREEAQRELIRMAWADKAVHDG